MRASLQADCTKSPRSGVAYAAGMALAAATGCAVLAGGGPLKAQTIQGHVLEAETGKPIRAALIVLEDSTGAGRLGTLTDSTGAFSIGAWAPGRYSIRAEFIGRETTRSGPLVLGAGTVVDLRLEAGVSAVMLKPLVVGKDRTCRIRPEAWQVTMQLWVEARKALEMSLYARAMRPYTVRLFSRALDPVRFTVRFARERDTTAAAFRPFAAAPEEVLHAGGYITQAAEGMTFNGLDEAVLLSDGFLDHHCLQLVKPDRKHPGQVGIAFVPVPSKVPEVKGVLWLEARSSRLRSYDFNYTHILYSIPRDAQGGHGDFDALPNGLVALRSWYLRMPVTRPSGMEPEMLYADPVQSGRSVRLVIESGGELVDAFAEEAR